MLARKDDWCHFAQRLERTSLHRHLKSGELGYEDAKFSYMVAAKEEVARVKARIIRHPLIGKGHKLRVSGPWSLSEMGVIMIDPKTGTLHAGADPRNDAYAWAW